MIRLTNFFALNLFACLSFHALAEGAISTDEPDITTSCKYGIPGSGADLKPFVTGSGRESDPYEIFYDAKSVVNPITNKESITLFTTCDITLVKKSKRGDENKNLSYLDDKIYFEYKYKDLPLVKSSSSSDFLGIKENAFTLNIGMNSDSSMTPSSIQDDNFPINPYSINADSNHSCPIVYNFAASEEKDSKGVYFNRYSAICPYYFGVESSDKISGSFKFFLSIQGKEQIKRFTDKKGILHGAAFISVAWRVPPKLADESDVETNFNLGE